MLFTVISKKSFSSAFHGIILALALSLILLTLALFLIYNGNPGLCLIVAGWQAASLFIFYSRRISCSASNPLYLIFSMTYLIYFLLPVSFYPVYSSLSIYLGSSMSFFGDKYLVPDCPALFTLAISASALLIFSSYTQSIKLISTQGRLRLYSFLSHVSGKKLFFTGIIIFVSSLFSSLFYSQGHIRPVFSDLLNLFFFDLTFTSIAIAWIYSSIDVHPSFYKLGTSASRWVSLLSIFIVIPALIGGSKGSALLLITRVLIPLFSLPYIFSINFVIVPTRIFSLLLISLAPFLYFLGEYLRFKFTFSYKMIDYSTLRQLDISSLFLTIIDRLSTELNNAYLLTSKALDSFLITSPGNMIHALKTAANLILPGTYFDGFAINTSNLLPEYFATNAFSPVYYDSRDTMILSLNTQGSTVFGDSVIYFGTLGFLLIPFYPFCFSYLFSFLGKLGFFWPSLLFPTSSFLFLISYGVDTTLKVASLFVFSLFVFTHILYGTSKIRL